MLNENLKIMRKSKGLSQEELARKLNVVRQTVSKWEKGLSVPDSEMLIKTADLFDVSVGELLGETMVIPEEADDIKKIAEKLEALNARFAEREERSRKCWRIATVAFAAVTVILLITLFKPMIAEFIINIVNSLPNSSVAIIGGADGPTQVYLSTRISKVWFIPIVASAVAAVIGFIKSRR